MWWQALRFLPLKVHRFVHQTALPSENSSLYTYCICSAGIWRFLVLFIICFGFLNVLFSFIYSVIASQSREWKLKSRSFPVHIYRSFLFVYCAPIIRSVRRSFLFPSNPRARRNYLGIISRLTSIISSPNSSFHNRSFQPTATSTPFPPHVKDRIGDKESAR